MDKVITATYLAQSIGSAYTLYLCSVSVKNLRQYEKPSQKAAEYSGTAAEQLHMTRLTQGLALVTALISLASSAVLCYTAIGPSGSPSPSSAPQMVLGLDTVCIVSMLISRSKVAGFWKGKPKVPFVEGFNEAIDVTTRIIRALDRLTLGWGLCVAYALLDIGKTWLT